MAWWTRQPNSIPFVLGTGARTSHLSRLLCHIQPPHHPPRQIRNLFDELDRAHQFDASAVAGAIREAPATGAALVAARPRALQQRSQPPRLLWRDDPERVDGELGIRVIAVRPLRSRPGAGRVKQKLIMQEHQELL